MEKLQALNERLLDERHPKQESIMEFLRRADVARSSVTDPMQSEWLSAYARFWSSQLHRLTGQVFYTPITSLAAARLQDDQIEDPDGLWIANNSTTGYSAMDWNVEEKQHTQEPEVTILMPCLNEESAIQTCVREARQALDAAGIVGEILVVDNGSVDHSAELARQAGARVVYEPRKGYGNVYLRGFKESRGKYIITGDSDGTYDFSLVSQFLEPLREGYDFVNGSRVNGNISPGAMPFFYRYVSIPVLRWLFNRLGGAKFSDPHCGMRGFNRDSIEKMELRTSGMELASEMVLQAARASLSTAELPIPYRTYKGEPKLRAFSEGWRHLRFMLLYTPIRLFAIPGIASLSAGLIILLALVWGGTHIGGIFFDTFFMIVGSLLTILGFQVLALGISGGMYAYSIGVLKHDPFISWVMRHLTLERGLVAGSSIIVLGATLIAWIFARWVSEGFDLSSPGILLRPALLGLTLFLLGVQATFSAFFISLLMLKIDKSNKQRGIGYENYREDMALLC